MVKISGLPPDTAPTTDDEVATRDITGAVTKRVTIAALITLIFNNVPAGTNNVVTRLKEALADFVVSGGVWTGDGLGTNRNASMTAMVASVNGRRISIAAVSAHTFTASKDTYVDLLDNGDNTGTLVYTEVTNGAAAPALASNSIRIAKIVTGATTIATSQSIVQSHGPDSLGNIIYNKNSTLGIAQPLIGRQGNSATDWSQAGGSNFDPTGTKVLRQAGAILVNANPTVVTFPVGYLNPPLVQATVATAASANVFVVSTGRTSTTASFRTLTDAGVVATTETINWASEGV